MPDIFLSYSRDDKDTARRFAEAFEREGLGVWWDATLNPGEAYDEVTEKALQEARAVVVLWSKKSVASRWVRAEATQANDNKTLVPVMIEPCKRPIMFELTHTVDLSHWNGDPGDPEWQAYLAGVRRFVHKDVAGAPVLQSAPLAPKPGRISPTAIAVALAAVLVAGVVVWAVNRHGSAAQSGSAATAATAPRQQVTIAVLPFANLSSDAEQEYFSDGLTEEILNQLAQVQSLAVTGRTSSFSFKGKNEDLRVIAEKLGVANLLEGSIRKDGGQLRITAQLINGKDGAHLWSKTYARELKDVFALQEEIAKDVTQALSIRLDVGDMRRAQGGTTSVDAYDKYLHARTLFYQLGPNELTQAIQLYRDSVTLDPDFARAWHGLYSALDISQAWIPENSVAARREMTEASAQVVKLAPTAWWTKAMQADRLSRQRKWTEAETAYRAALASAPASDIDAIFANIDFLTAVGRVKEAAIQAARARQMDPLSLRTSGFLQIALDFAGRSSEAQAEYVRSNALAGDHAIWDWWALKRLWVRPDATQAAIDTQYQVLLEHESLRMPLNRIVADAHGNRDKALAAIRQAFRDPANQDATRLGIIAEYAENFGDTDLALAALRKITLEMEYSLVSQVMWAPQKNGLRADPRFKDIVRDMGLVDYWRSSGTWTDFCKPVGPYDFECH